MPPVHFVRLVRDALVHLYDPAHLLAHRLHGYLGGAMPSEGDPGQNLRNLLIDSIERLEPPSGYRLGDKEHRPYWVLTQLYVIGFPIEGVAAKLHVGPRQARRELSKGLRALASYLWAFCPHGLADGCAEGDGYVTSLRREVQVLGVQLDTASPMELVASVRTAADSLARDYGVSLSIKAAGQVGLCCCDRALARQAILSCLTALLRRRPKAIEVTVTEIGSMPALEATVVPPPPGGVDDLDEELETARSLALAQGGEIRVIMDREGRCRGVRLAFGRAEGPHVLLIDDNVAMLHLYRRYLASGGYRVSAAASAEEAMALLERAAPDAVVLDVLMRGADGWEVLEQLRSRSETRAVPVVICSVLSEPELARSLGATAYLKKPVASRDLLGTLRRAVAKSSRVGPSQEELSGNATTLS